jgi:putative ABC transport system ATP-binding protein
MSELLALADVSKHYRRGSRDLRVLDGVDLRVRRGEVVSVLGTRGQGKTTLLQIAAGMESPDSGVVRFDGEDLAALSDAGLSRLLGSRIAWAGRSGPRMRTRMLDYVAMPLLVGRGGRARRRGGPRGEAGRGGTGRGETGRVETGRAGAGGRRSERDVYARARAVLERVGASGCAEQGWESMSDWERALVEVAQAIAGEPELLLVDDLTDALGIGETDELCGLLRALSGESQMGVLTAVSDAHAALFSDRILTLAEGRLTESPASPDANVIDFPDPGAGRRAVGRGSIP